MSTALQSFDAATAQATAHGYSGGGHGGSYPATALTSTPLAGAGRVDLLSIEEEARRLVRPHPQGGYTVALPFSGSARVFAGGWRSKRLALSAARAAVNQCMAAALRVT